MIEVDAVIHPCDRLPLNRLQCAFDACYKAFLPYPQPLAFTASPHRNPAALLKSLTSAPLRELSAAQLGPYAGYALTTVGDVEDYKHFLPRIFELAIQLTGQPGLGAEVIALRLKQGRWREWPIEEQAAVEAVFRDAFALATQGHVGEADVQGWLCGMAILDLPLADVLDDWLTNSNADHNDNARLQIAQFIHDAAGFLHAVDAAGQAFWSYANEATLHFMRAWVASVSVTERMIAALHGPSADRWIVEHAMKVLADVQSQTTH